MILWAHPSSPTISSSLIVESARLRSNPTHRPPRLSAHSSHSAKRRARSTRRNNAKASSCLVRCRLAEQKSRGKIPSVFELVYKILETNATKIGLIFDKVDQRQKGLKFRKRNFKRANLMFIGLFLVFGSVFRIILRPALIVAVTKNCFRSVSQS